MFSWIKKTIFDYSNKYRCLECERKFIIYVGVVYSFFGLMFVGYEFVKWVAVGKFNNVLAAIEVFSVFILATIIAALSIYFIRFKLSNFVINAELSDNLIKLYKQSSAKIYKLEEFKKCKVKEVVGLDVCFGTDRPIKVSFPDGEVFVMVGDIRHWFLTELAPVMGLNFKPKKVVKINFWVKMGTLALLLLMYRFFVFPFLSPLISPYIQDFLRNSNSFIFGLF